MATIEEITSRIFGFVNDSPGKTLLGVRLGILLRDNFPGFSPTGYDCRNLRQFVARYVPTVKESGRSGADITYAITADTPPGAPPAAPASGHLDLPVDAATWKAFSNPSYPYNVATNPQTGECRAVPVLDQIVPPWVPVQKCASEDLREIARSFVGTLTEAQRAHLLRVLDDQKWFVRFFGILQHVGLGTSWGSFKRERLIKKFESALSEAGVANPRASRLSGPSQSTARRPHSHDADEEAQLRQLAVRVANTLPIAELRLLRVPLGDIFDAMTGRNQ